MDTSGSMDFRMDKDKDARPGESRLDYAKTAANDLVNSVVKNGNDVRVAVVSFNRDAKTVVGYTSDKGELRRGIDGLWADDGTNWEAGLAAANGLTARDGAKKYIVFLSDVELTQAAYDAAATAGKTTTLPTNAEGKLSYSVVNDNGTTQTVVAGADQSYQPQSVDVPVNVVSIQKTWVGGTKRPDSLSVHLLCNDREYKTVALDAAAGYKADVVVPAGVGDSVWSVSEDNVPAGYTPTYGDPVTNSGTLSITNTYSVSPVKVYGKESLFGHKTLTGRDLIVGEFSFQLKDAQGNVVSTATNDADGNFAFDDLTFDEAGTNS